MHLTIDPSSLLMKKINLKGIQNSNINDYDYYVLFLYLFHRIFNSSIYSYRRLHVKMAPFFVEHLKITSRVYSRWSFQLAGSKIFPKTNYCYTVECVFTLELWPSYNPKLFSIEKSDIDITSRVGEKVMFGLFIGSLGSFHHFYWLQ